MANSRSTLGQTARGDVVAHVVQPGPSLRKCQPLGTHAPTSNLSLSKSLRSAMQVVGASAADVASWCDVTPRTVQRWLAGEQPVSVAQVMLSRRLWPVFLDELRAVTLERTGT